MIGNEKFNSNMNTTAVWNNQEVNLHIFSDSHKYAVISNYIKDGVRCLSRKVVPLSEIMRINLKK